MEFWANDDSGRKMKRMGEEKLIKAANQQEPKEEIGRKYSPDVMEISVTLTLISLQISTAELLSPIFPQALLSIRPFIPSNLRNHFPLSDFP